MTDRPDLAQLVDAILLEEASIALHESALAISRVRLAQLRAMRTALAGGAGWMDGATRSRLADLRRGRGED
ncbi:hypothetical protein GCM10011335_37820 [Aureimonas glaciei]|uniref:Uncharacterized protein n=1 Tax=Aureimonas glaciei TaxID=1776957 RepID=A0A916Y5E0_9HYPH|nr:hypothetical protein GCM10011335_37820 [Aureimonas glaciei]